MEDMKFKEHHTVMDDSNCRIALQVILDVIQVWSECKIFMMVIVRTAEDELIEPSYDKG